MDFSAAAVERTQTRKTEAAAAGLTARVEEPQPETRGLMKGKGNNGNKVRVRAKLPAAVTELSMPWFHTLQMLVASPAAPLPLATLPNAEE